MLVLLEVAALILIAIAGFILVTSALPTGLEGGVPAMGSIAALCAAIAIVPYCFVGILHRMKMRDQVRPAEKASSPDQHS